MQYVASIKFSNIKHFYHFLFVMLIMLIQFISMHRILYNVLYVPCQIYHFNNRYKNYYLNSSNF